MPFSMWRLPPVAIIGLSLLLAACDDAPEQAGTEMQAPSVSVAGVVKRDVVDLSTFIGRVQPVDEADLIARVSGFLDSREVTEGAYVEKGEILFRIERDSYEAALARAKAAVAEAEAQLALAEIELERDTRLLASDTIAQSRFDATKAARDSAAALLEAERAQVRQAELDLSYTEIRAPFDGRLGQIAFSEGDVVGPQQGAIATIVRTMPMDVAFSLGEGEFLTVAERYQHRPTAEIDPADSPPVRVILPNGRTHGEIGRVVFIDNRVDDATGTIALRARFGNENGLLVPGAFVSVRVESREAVPRLLLPQAAVQRDQQGDFVLVVGPEGTVEQRHVRLDGQHETFFIVEEGLQAGESVIVEGIQRVRPGVPVNAVPTDAGPAREG